MAISPLLAVVDRGREEEIEQLLERYAGQVSDLLQEVVRLTATGAARPASIIGEGGPNSPDHAELLARTQWIEEEIRQLQHLVADSSGDFEPSRRLGYRETVDRVRASVAKSTPTRARVLVISRGDRELVRLEDRNGEHFPQDEVGDYLGHHPADSDQAIELLEALRARGADYLVLPPTSIWWLDHYRGFASYLGNFDRVEVEHCQIYDLSAKERS